MHDHPHLPRRRALQLGLGLLMSSALPAARACEFFASTLRITHPWSRAAQEGDPFAMVSMRIDEVTQADRLIRAETPVAAAVELHGHPGSPAVDLPIPAGRETLLGEQGVTLRLVGLRHALELGRTYPLTLVFERGGVVNASMDIDFERSR